MAQTINVNFRTDPIMKKNMEIACKRMGLSMSAALNLFVYRVATEQKIPFEVKSVDPFYSENNIKYLEKEYEDLKSGRMILVNHDLIED